MTAASSATNASTSQQIRSFSETVGPTPMGQSSGSGLQLQAALQQLLQKGQRGDWKLPASAALATVESADFHWQLANVDRQRWTKNGLKAR